MSARRSARADFPDPYDHPDGVDCVYIRSSISGDDEMYDVRCSCSSDSPCVDDSCPCVAVSSANYSDGKLIKAKLTESNSSVFECSANCSCEDCQNSLTQKGPSKCLRIAHLGPKGYGVLADDDIAEGSYVCEYAGEILADGSSTADWRYVVTLNETTSDGRQTATFIDASRFGNVGRYLNHSCSPNCALVPVRYEQVAPKVGIFAIRDVRRGEEVCYSYGAGAPSSTPCLCGSATCRLFLPAGGFAKND
ncbi:unnamed protein product [Nesidiocoris tenuis]|uniref:SET domain-containing protein n=1 Tax=Nesidiocoris tenuis TaxID=355587 RepID=A0A6H5FWV3_9HEMI|nr:unnamed protein product [Nesidiocoris tenuis]